MTTAPTHPLRIAAVSALAAIMLAAAGTFVAGHDDCSTCWSTPPRPDVAAQP